MRRSPAQDDVAAVFDDRAHAEQAVEELCDKQAAIPHLRVAVHGHESRVFELDEDVELAHSVRSGITIGVPLGAVGGLLLVVAAMAMGDSDATPAQLLAAGALPGLLGGALFGGFAGVLRALWLEDDIDRWEHVPLTSGQVLVVARAHGHATDVRTVMQRHGGHWIADPAMVTAPFAPRPA